MVLVVAVLVGFFTLFPAPPALAEPTWEGGRFDCRTDQQVRLVVNYRGVLHIQWSELGGSRHEAGPYYSPFYKPFTYDTGASAVVWRAVAEPDSSNIPGDIGNAYATCI